MEKRQQILKRNEERLTDEAKVLDQYLSQYRYCIRKKQILENRQSEIAKEFNNPLLATKISPPKENKRGQGCAALTFCLDEINTRLQKQMDISAKTLISIMDVIELLPENSLEREIIENKYIDCYRWEKICIENHISKTPAVKNWKKGLYMLLESKKVRNIMSQYRVNS